MTKPVDAHWSAVKRILRYLKHTISHCLLLHCDAAININAFFDADWVGCPDDWRSTSGYYLFLGRNLVSWSSWKQRIVSRSRIESEYRAIAHVAVEVIWLQSLLRELGVSPPNPLVLWCDNIGATYLTSNPLFHARTKHIGIDFHFMRDLVAFKSLIIRFLSFKDQLADTFTKPQPMAHFTQIWANLNVREFPLQLQGRFEPSAALSTIEDKLQQNTQQS